MAGLVAGAAWTSGSAGAQPAALGKIQHIVLLYQENHTFDNLLGAWCVQTRHCNGTTLGPNGTPLGPLRDIVPNIGHGTGDQKQALAGKWLEVTYCSKGLCLSQYQPNQVPILTSLAGKFALSDNTFASAPVPSAGAHLLLSTATLDGFTGDIPRGPNGQGWGCPSKRLAQWSPTGLPPYRLEPMCVPYLSPTGQIPRNSPVAHVDSIFDRLQAAGLSWKDYGAPASWWDPCSYLADCQYTTQQQHVDPKAKDIITDAATGKLPAVSIVIPDVGNSEHNLSSMIRGQDWIASIVNAIQAGPQWKSTAVMITYDDCGCFYDHVTPPAGSGFRVPFVMVSPFARPGTVDHAQGTFASILALIEHTFHLRPLNANDASAYDYSGMLNLAQAPLAPSLLPRVPASQLPPGASGNLNPDDT
jgi:phospholipase C